MTKFCVHLDFYSESHLIKLKEEISLDKGLLGSQRSIGCFCSPVLAQVMTGSFAVIVKSRRPPACSKAASDQTFRNSMHCGDQLWATCVIVNREI